MTNDVGAKLGQEAVPAQWRASLTNGLNPTRDKLTTWTFVFSVSLIKINILSFFHVQVFTNKEI